MVAFRQQFRKDWSEVSQRSQAVLIRLCAGHGFKLAAVVGRILGDLATTGRTNYDLRHFAISRFSVEKAKL